jgi:hypothetical protein
VKQQDRKQGPEPKHHDMPARTPVVVTMDDGTKWHTFTRSEPWQLAGGTWVVSLVGKTGGYLLDRVEPVKVG